jgi:hypothetical protein
MRRFILILPVAVLSDVHVFLLQIYGFSYGGLKYGWLVKGSYLLSGSVDPFADDTWALSLYIPSCIRNCWRPILLQNHEVWDALDTKLLHHAVRKRVAMWDGEPWHFSVVLIELSLGFITADEDYFELLTRSIHFVVEVDQDWGESSAWRTPMSGEVKGNYLAFTKHLVSRYSACLGFESLAYHSFHFYCKP